MHFSQCLCQVCKFHIHLFVILYCLLHNLSNNENWIYTSSFNHEPPLLIHCLLYVKTFTLSFKTLPTMLIILILHCVISTLHSTALHMYGYNDCILPIARRSTHSPLVSKCNTTSPHALNISGMMPQIPAAFLTLILLTPLLTSSCIISGSPSTGTLGHNLYTSSRSAGPLFLSPLLSHVNV